MVITKTPFRMSFFGGGTDIEDYFRNNNGAVISTTFDKYCYVSVRHLPHFFPYTTELSYSKIERVTNVEDIDHPAIKNAMKMIGLHDIRLTYEADLPARSGLGTSSSFAVGMLHAFHCYEGKYVGKRQLADEAIYLERKLCKEAGGWQDQIAASFGGFNRIDFDKEGYYVKPIIMPKERKEKLNNSLMMFFTGFTRLSSEIQQTNATVRKNRIKELREMHTLVDEAERILVNPNKNIDEFGSLLDYTWQLKKKTGNNISTSSIDELYERGKKAGALGGKLLGAGGGGFLLFYVPVDKQKIAYEMMKDLLYIPFRFENTGTCVMHYSPEDDEEKGSNNNITIDLS